jgi:phage recombination protein Bet
MKQELTSVDQNAYLLSAEQIETLSQAGVIPKNTPAAQVQIFAQVCQEKGLSPFSREIHLISYGGTYAPIVGIDGRRKIAAETGVHLGTSAAMYNRKSDASFYSLAECKTKGMKTPHTCTIIVKKLVGGHIVEFSAEVAFDEFKKSGSWSSMPFHRLAVVAESHALRKAFPNRFSGLLLEEEVHLLSDTQQFESAVNDTVTSESKEDREIFLKTTKQGLEAFDNYIEFVSFSIANPGLGKDEDVLGMLKANKQRLLGALTKEVQAIESEDELNEKWVSDGFEKADEKKPKWINEVKAIFGDRLSNIQNGEV